MDQTQTEPNSRVYNILLADDDLVLQKMYSRRLAADGHRIFLVTDGEEAFAIFEKENIDLILTDIMMPRVSGVEFIAKVRKTNKGKNIPVVAWSNLDQEDEKKKLESLGVNEYLLKGSLTLEQVSETVKKYLQ